VATPAPRLVAFGCRRALQALAADGGPVGALPVGLQLVEVPCAGRVGLTQLLDAFEAGAEGVLVLACHEGNCRSEQGSAHARRRVEEAGRLLAEIGLGAERVRFETLAPNQGARLRRLLGDFETQLAALGPGPLVAAR
jgi:coenzyme F420-reducing hydrogenase delta subunit